MENTVKQTILLEKTGVFDEDLKNRYELRLTYNGIKGKKVLLISMNPASNNVQVLDTTTNYLLNNLGIFPIFWLILKMKRREHLYNLNIALQVSQL